MPCLVLEPEEQLGTLQLLIYLLPPCNCDTLHRLLQFLSIVARHAEDNVSKDGQEVRTPPPPQQMLWFFLFPVLKGRAKKYYKWMTMQNRNRLTDIENKRAVTKRETDAGRDEFG